MFGDCLSLADSQYVILLIVLVIQVSMYRQHPLFRYGVAVTLLLLAIYPIFFDALPRELFSLLFSVLLLGYLTQLIYISVKGVRQAIVPSVLVGVYLIMFFVITMTLNTALLFTRPIDIGVVLYKKTEDGIKLASKVYEKVKK